MGILGESGVSRVGMGIYFGFGDGERIVFGWGTQGICWARFSDFSRVVGLPGSSCHRGMAKWEKGDRLDGRSYLSFFSLRGMGDLEGSVRIFRPCGVVMGVNVWRGIFIRSPSVGRAENRSLDLGMVSSGGFDHRGVWVFTLSGGGLSDWSCADFGLGNGATTRL